MWDQVVGPGQLVGTGLEGNRNSNSGHVHKPRLFVEGYGKKVGHELDQENE